MNKDIVIVGGGISGLAIAFWLKKNNLDFILLDKNPTPGGVMESFWQNDYLFDRGPNSGLEVTPLIKQIVDEVGLTNDYMYADEAGDNRYILRNNTLHSLPTKASTFLKTKLFSGKAKLRLLGEPFAKRSGKDGYNQSLAEFVVRRLGKEFLDYAIDPFVSGVYAGSPHELSVKSAFPKLYALEENYGGLIVGSVKSARARKKRAETSKHVSRMFTFKDGMQTFPKAIANYIGSNLIFDAGVTKVYKTNSGYSVQYAKDGTDHSVDCKSVITAIPSYEASKVLGDIDNNLLKHLDEVYYPPVIVLYLVYKKEVINRPLDGFGFLIPSKEKKSFLGAIWSSVIFPNRTTPDKASFTLFIGGSRNPQIIEEDKDKLIKKVIEEFQDIMHISGKPIYNSHKFWLKAIPQYNVGYNEHEIYFQEVEKNNPGLFLGGNFRGGIAVGDCIKNSEIIFNKVKSFLN